VQTGDYSSGLDYASTDSLSLNGGTIQDAVNNAAVLTLPSPGAESSLSANKAIVVVIPMTRTVTKLVDTHDGVCDLEDCSLREAIVSANPGDTIDFRQDVTGTILLSSQLDVDKDLIITGPGAELLNVSGNDAVRVFDIGSTKEVSISGLTITSGYVTNEDGAGFLVGESARLSLNAVIISKNTVVSSGTGGGIAIMRFGSLTMTNSILSDNTAPAGGGIYSNSNTAIFLDQVSILDNQSTVGSGGGMYNDGGTPSLTNVTFSGNTANNYGGGGIYNNAGDLSLTNVTISGNTANYGGGIFNNHANPSFTNVTVVGNIANDGGGIFNYFSNPVITNSILYGNSNGGITNEDSAPIVTYSIVQGGYAGDGNINADPLLGPLQNNGSATPTHALQAASPAIDAGNGGTCPATDQRGVTRPQYGQCDIGAYEYLDNTAPAVTNVSSTTANGTYSAGSVITITLTFSEIVNVTGTPQLALETGSTDRMAAYASGSGSNTLTFIYSVQAGDRSSDLDYVSVNSLILNGGTIKDAMNNNAVLTLPSPGAAGSLGVNKAIVIVSKKVLQLKSAGTQDGWVLETSENSKQGGTIDAAAATFMLGDTASRQQYRAILSFNTSSLPENAIITKVVLKIKKQSVTGTNPFTTHQKIAVDSRKGAFSNNAALQPADFQAAASKPAVGLLANNPQAGGWYWSTLKAFTYPYYPYINRTGITQLRLRFQTDDDNDAVADFLRFYSGNATIAANRPVLVIEYYVP
jgi:CSLREA domain-containing protein